MTPTSDERRVVAEWLRGPFDVCRCEGHTYINGLFLGMQVCARDEIGLRKGMRHLAELIDPTCNDFGGEEGTNGEGYDFACSACGYVCDLPEPSYCPNCGARVIEMGEG